MVRKGYLATDSQFIETDWINRFICAKNFISSLNFMEFETCFGMIFDFLFLDVLTLVPLLGDRSSVKFSCLTLIGFYDFICFCFCCFLIRHFGAANAQCHQQLPKIRKKILRDKLGMKLGKYFSYFPHKFSSKKYIKECWIDSLTTIFPKQVVRCS